jgi:hypothetical protein
MAFGKKNNSIDPVAIAQAAARPRTAGSQRRLPKGHYGAARLHRAEFHRIQPATSSSAPVMPGRTTSTATRASCTPAG